MQSSPRRRSAFSLVELSIVLVILGLLTGGILAGQSLIRASELRSITTEHGNILTAVRGFRDKYMALPGDMTNAEKFWGTAAGCGFSPAWVPGPGPSCNGNGDGMVSQVGLYMISSPYGVSYEKGVFWQHLANAGLLNYTEGLDRWAATAKTATWQVDNIGRITNWGQRPKFFDGNYGQTITAMGLGTNGTNTIGLLMPEEAWNIDTKMDDGMPAIGGVVAGEALTSVWGMEGCTDTTSQATLTANYRLDSKVKSCGLGFRNAF